MGFSFVKISLIGAVGFFFSMLKPIHNKWLIISLSMMSFVIIYEVIWYGTIENFLFCSRLLGCVGIFQLVKRLDNKQFNLATLWYFILGLIIINLALNPPITTGKLGLQGFLGPLTLINPPQGFVGSFAGLSLIVAIHRKLFFWAFIFFLILYISNSRAAIVALLVIAPLYNGVIMRFKGLYFGTIIIILLTLLIYLYNNSVSWAYISSGRSVIYSIFIESILKYPFLGIGSHENSAAVTRFFETYLNQSFFDNAGNRFYFGANHYVSPHNDYFLISFRGGFVLLFAIGALFKYLWQSSLCRSDDNFLIIIFTYFFVFIFFENGITWPVFYAYLGYYVWQSKGR